MNDRLASEGCRKERRFFPNIGADPGGLDELARTEVANAAPPPQVKEMLDPDPPGVFYIQSADKPQVDVAVDAAGDGLWRVKVGSRGAAGRGLPGREQTVVRPETASTGARTLESRSHRPDWIATDVYPRLKPLGSVADLHIDRDIRLPPMMWTRDALMQMPLPMWPWHCIGKVQGGFDMEFDKPRVSGTAALVGRNSILTAAHCAVWGRGPGKWWMRFFPAFLDGPSADKGDSFVESFQGPGPVSSAGHGDFVVCKLFKPLGEALGFFGAQWASNDDFYYNRRWFSVGYPSKDFGGKRPVAGVDLKCVDVDDSGDSSEIEFGLNDYFLNGGWSGGPLFGFFDGDPRIAGVCSGWSMDGYDPARTVFVGGKPMFDRIIANL